MKDFYAGSHDESIESPNTMQNRLRSDMNRGHSISHTMIDSCDDMIDSMDQLVHYNKNVMKKIQKPKNQPDTELRVLEEFPNLQKAKTSGQSIEWILDQTGLKDNFFEDSARF